MEIEVKLLVDCQKSCQKTRRDIYCLEEGRGCTLSTPRAKSHGFLCVHGDVWLNTRDPTSMLGKELGEQVNYGKKR